MNSLSLSAVIVVYNEETHLSECLSNLMFCDELIVIDLGSTDSSVNIAESFDARIIHHERVAVVEEIREWAVLQAKYDWVIILDPDEIFPKPLVLAIKNLILSDMGLAYIGLPRQNYYMNRPVLFGRWGTIQFPARVLNRNHVTFDVNVHSPLKVKSGYHALSLKPISTEETIKHYWIDNEEQFFSKHKRYLQYEGKAMHTNGKTYSTIKALSSVVSSFFFSFLKKRGFLLGSMGLDLACKWSWYDYNKWKQLKVYEEKSLFAGYDREIPKTTNMINSYSLLFSLKRSRVFRYLKNFTGYSAIRELQLFKSYIHQLYFILNSVYSTSYSSFTLISSSMSETFKCFSSLLAKESCENFDVDYISFDINSDIMSIAIPNTNKLIDLPVIVSTVEYLGVSDNYRIASYKPNKDILFMQELLNIFSAGSLLLLVIPVGCDYLYVGKERVYGKDRIKFLLEGWLILENRFYLTKGVDNWHEVDIDFILTHEQTHNHSSLGVFFLQKPL